MVTEMQNFLSKRLIQPNLSMFMVGFIESCMHQKQVTHLRNLTLPIFAQKYPPKGQNSICNE